MDFGQTLQTRTPPRSQHSDALPDEHLVGMAEEIWDEGNQDLMLVDWLCVDFRQRLLNVLYTSCQSNFNEARDLAKEKLLELVDRMAISDDSNPSQYPPPPIDVGVPIPSPPTNLAHEDASCEPRSNPTPVQQSTPGEDNVMYPQIPISHTGRRLRDHTPQETICAVQAHNGSLTSVPPLPDNALSLDCAEFMNFDLLSDGEVFSIGRYGRGEASESIFVPSSNDLSEMDLDPPQTTPGSRACPYNQCRNDTTASVEQYPSLPTETFPGLSPPDTPRPSLASFYSHRRQKRSRPTARPALHQHSPAPPRSPKSVASAGSPSVTDAASHSLHSTSPSWTHLIPSHLPSPDTVLSDLTSRLGDGKQPIALLLTRMFYAIGSPDALHQLRHAVKLSRDNAPVLPNPSSTNDLAATVQVLDHLDSMSTLSHILRRYYLVRLLEHRNRLEEDHVTAKLAWRRSKRLLKYDTARVEMLKSGAGRETSQRGSESESSSRPKYRSKSQALVDLMRMLYPDLKPLPGETREQQAGHVNKRTQECVYTRRLTKLRNRLSCARNWYKFQQTFPGGILALIPCAGRFSISIDQIEKLPSETVQIFLGYLQEHRGDFLRSISQTLSPALFDVLARRDTTTAFPFEQVDENAFGDGFYDTHDMIRLCEPV
ncbi:hypothetical protein BJX66DRAFT_335220 [Aspergillus keveii]|uniref:Uncharacterized protein n=1 Tax=Aspergillus keveii TaxID=714993 RepID=A0ABR4GE45_9EURO